MSVIIKSQLSPSPSFPAAASIIWRPTSAATPTSLVSTRRTAPSSTRSATLASTRGSAPSSTRRNAPASTRRVAKNYNDIIIQYTLLHM